MGEVVVLGVLKAHVLDRYRRLVSEAEQKSLILFVELAVVLLVEKLEHTNDASFKSQGHAQNGTCLEPTLPVDAPLETRILGDVVHDRGLADTGRPASDPLTGLQAHRLDRPGSAAGGRVKAKLALVVIEQNRACLRSNGLSGRLDNGRQQYVEMNDAAIRFGDLEDRGKFLDVLCGIAQFHLNTGLLRRSRATASPNLRVRIACVTRKRQSIVARVFVTFPQS